MNPELAKSVNEAEQIRTSGRWDNVSKVIEKWAAQRKTKDDLWYGNVFSQLSSRVFFEYSSLKEAYSAAPPRDDIALLSWRARNLLELTVWVTFCAMDRNRARQFSGDLGRDLVNLVDEFKRWGEARKQHSEWFEPGFATREELKKTALIRGESIEGKFTKVAAAAHEVGMGPDFTLANKFFSKYAHPTAMLLLGNPEPVTVLKEIVFSQGCFYFIGAFMAIEHMSTQVDQGSDDGSSR